VEIGGLHAQIFLMETRLVDPARTGCSIHILARSFRALLKIDCFAYSNHIINLLGRYVLEHTYGHNVNDPQHDKSDLFYLINKSIIMQAVPTGYLREPMNDREHKWRDSSREPLQLF
jgi:hypothetical protein